MTHSHTGQCLCGAVRYAINAAPLLGGVCHCRNCQKQSGSAFSLIWGVPINSLSFTHGAPKRYLDPDTDSGEPLERFFCGDCGSPLYSAVPATPDIVYVKAGTLDDTTAFTPQFHAWCSTKQHWLELTDGLPQKAR